MNLRKLTLLFFIMTSVGLSHAQSFYLCTQGDTRTASQVTFSNNGSTLNGNIQTNTIDSITMHVPALKYVGGDISLLPKYEEQGAQFKDKNGNAITDLVSFVREQGWNTIRVRLFVDPVKGQAITDDVNKKEVVQDLDFVTTLGKRIKDAGMLFMLDFHYSDTYADPSKQWTPQDWQSLNDDQLKTKLYEYTRDCLQQLKDNGAAPDFIQTGNEISYGMLWGAKGTSANRCYSTSSADNWNRFFDLLREASKACREVCPQAKIILHSERVPKVNVLTDYFDRMKEAQIDFDIIGLSYYPYFHGALSVLENTLTTLENKKYGKDIQIVETGYPWKWVVPGTTTDLQSTYPYSNEGQKKYTTDLISLLKSHPQVNGLSWWWAEANAKGATGNLNTDWYNASLFDNNTGKALDALYELQSFK
ncbi:glycosyl hydrolase 53 family protein [Xylanibacter brevis]|uniref:glycosyl hydrolase 53 family protein n=1 Tax=Xylanibacter brevis TaxID=83231 RepID=UPI0009DEB6DF|nr:glycosyl hydrolase 53 family protein [Xylanibacter brevis]